MKCFPRVNFVAVPIVFGSIAIAASIANNSRPGDVVMPIEEAKFKAVDSELAQPGRAKLSIAPLWEDSQTGQRSYLLKWTKGDVHRHDHPFAYQLVVLKGVMTHWSEGLPEAAEKKLSVGGVYYQPAGVLHAETCLSEECITLSTILESRNRSRGAR